MPPTSVLRTSLGQSGFLTLSLFTTGACPASSLRLPSDSPASQRCCGKRRGGCRGVGDVVARPLRQHRTWHGRRQALDEDGAAVRQCPDPLVHEPVQAVVQTGCCDPGPPPPNCVHRQLVLQVPDVLVQTAEQQVEVALVLLGGLAWNLMLVCRQGKRRILRECAPYNTAKVASISFWARNDCPPLRRNCS